MATGFQWTELGLKYWKQISGLILFVLSLSGYGVYDAVITDKNKAIQEVTEGFQTVLQEVAPIKVASEGCGQCESLLNKHIKEYKQNLREFHGVK